MKKGLLFILTAVLLAGLLAACGTSEKPKDNAGGDQGGDKKTELVMGTSSDYPPFEFVDTAKSDEIIGFDIDIANAIAKELGYTVTVKDIDFTGLIPAIQAKQVDFVMAGMTPTPERKENVDFSDIYYTANHMIVSKKDSGIKSLEDLQGKTVGVQLSSIQEEKAEEIAKEIKIKKIEQRNRIPELIQEMKAGRIDAAIIEDIVANGYFKNNPDLGGFTIQEDGDEAGSAIAFPKGSDLTEDFNRVLNEMKDSGELDKLILKWFGGEE